MKLKLIFLLSYVLLCIIFLFVYFFTDNFITYCFLGFVILINLLFNAYYATSKEKIKINYNYILSMCTLLFLTSFIGLLKDNSLEKVLSNGIVVVSAFALIILDFSFILLKIKNQKRDYCYVIDILLIFTATLPASLTGFVGYDNNLISIISIIVFITFLVVRILYHYFYINLMILKN